jgi:hypothetical protein
MNRTTPFLIGLEKAITDSASDWRQVVVERRRRQMREVVAEAEGGDLGQRKHRHRTERQISADDALCGG